MEFVGFFFNFVFFEREDIGIFPGFLFNAKISLVYATYFSPKSRSSLCCYTEMFCGYQHSPALQNLFYKIPVERRGLVPGTHLGRFGATEMGGEEEALMSQTLSQQIF